MGDFARRGTGAVKGRVPRGEKEASAAASRGGLERYLAEIASQLHVDPAAERDILAEVRSHLEEATTELRASGLGEEGSLAAAIDRFGASREIGRMLNRLHGEPLWMKVGLAILPGLFALGSASGLFNEMFGSKIGETLDQNGMIGVCLLVIAISLALEHRFPVWSYPASGVLVLRIWFGMPWPSVEQSGSFWAVAPPLLMLGGLAVIAAIVAYRVCRWPGLRSHRPGWALLGLIILIAVAFPAGPLLINRDADWGSAVLAMLPLSLWWMGLLLLPVVIGLPLAQRSGLAAALMVVAGQYVLAEVLDPAYGMLIWTSDHAAARLLSSLPALTFLIVPPAWVLLSRHAKVSFWGLVLPPLLGLLSLSLIRAVVLQGTAIEYGAGRWLTDFLAGAQLVTLFAVTGLVYHRLRPSESIRAECTQSGPPDPMAWGHVADERRA